jgi:hypothetical protein
MSAEFGPGHEDCQKILRSKQAEFDKLEALLHQKVELLEARIEDNLKREQQMKQIHETMLSALQMDSLE